MLEDPDARKKLFIGNSVEEIGELASKIGYPIHLIPFGSKGGDACESRTPVILRKKPTMQQSAVFGNLRTYSSHSVNILMSFEFFKSRYLWLFLFLHKMMLVTKWYDRIT